MVVETSEQPIISSDFPFKPQYVTVKQNRMHYVEQGQGDPILCIHGMPVSSYVWRNVIPGLATVGRCIAVDLIGMGHSDKPEIAYTINDHIDYISGFIDALDLKNVTLVLHGWGSIIGLAWAMQHPERLKSLVFSESHLRPITNWDMISLPVKQVSRRLLESKDEYAANMKIHEFVEQVLDAGSLRKLTPQEKAHYEEPFSELNSTLPIRQYIKEFPLGNERNAVVDTVTDYSKKLQQSSVPKLLLYAVPGFIATIDSVVWAKEHLPNITLVDLGEAMHFPQESDPQGFTQAIVDWLPSS